MADDKFLITLIIDDRRYPLEIKRSEEEAFRFAAKQINKRIEQYKIALSDKDSDMNAQDFIALTALQALVENFDLKDKNNTKPYEDKINLLLIELDHYLSKK